MSNNKARISGLTSAFAFLFILTQGLGATSFSSFDLISIPASGTEGIANPYPSTIDASGLTGAITDVNVTINGLSHTFPDDIDVLLVGPGGLKIILMSDAGGPHDVTNINLTFDDQAGAALPNGSALASGSFTPANYTGNGGANDFFPGPAPAGPYGSLLSIFNGSDPNGTWSLFVFDDEGADVGTIANGWSLDITTAISEPSTLVLFGAGLLALAGRKRIKR
ncbi:MAG: PEP-CTERM sorting domain-containing protein [Candidatus Binatia bacterium]